MFAHERLRTTSRGGAGDDAVTFPESASINPGGAGGYNRLYKPRRPSHRRLLNFALRTAAALVILVLLAVWYVKFYAVAGSRSASQSSTPPSKQNEVASAGVSRTRDPTTQATLKPPQTGLSRPTAAVPTTVSRTPTTQPSRFTPKSTLPGLTEAPPTELDRRTVRPRMFAGDRTNQREEGEYQPEEPERLPGLTVKRQTFTPDELLAKFGDTTFIYSFVNGSEQNHHYRKEIRTGCMRAILAAESESYDRKYPMFLVPTTTSRAPETTPAVEEIDNGTQRLTQEVALFHMNPFTVLKCNANRLRNLFRPGCTLGEVVAAVRGVVNRGVDNRDRETDELRHSIRSVEQHVRWHRGRVVIVSPGHHPTWVDGAKNFLAGVCGDAAVQALRTRETHLRLTTVHQDAIMPYGEKMTADSHVVEQHLWRVLNTTAVHVYMNDDYFVNRDVAITDLFNEYGGTIVRTESGILNFGAVADQSASWAQGVLHAQQFNILELDVHHEDELPRALVKMWTNMARLGFDTSPTGLLPTIQESKLTEMIDIARNYEPEPMTREPQRPRRPRRYATHAPFVYCTNMFRFFATRYEREFALTSLNHRSRMARDWFIPFLYNAFIMARPWQASPKFLPYLLQLQRSRDLQKPEILPRLNITLDNFDGCGPATLRGGARASECTYGKFLDNLTLNENVVNHIANSKPLYFNINAGFSSVSASKQLRKFLHDKFPTPVYLEDASGTSTADPQGAGPGEEEGKAATTVTGNGVALAKLFASLMQLPVVGVVSYEEGACPLVRSLSLLFAGHHRGRVHVAVQRHGDGAADETLRELRLTLGHRIYSATPVPQCGYSTQVTNGTAMRAETVADVARRVLQPSDGAGVELPSTCGGGSGGLRVRGFVIDARTPHAPVQSVAALPSALAMPGQTLALEDFRAVRVGPEERDVVLVLAREDAAAKAVHWITGAAENELLVTFPLPVEAYEDFNKELVWSQP